MISDVGLIGLYLALEAVSLDLQSVTEGAVYRESEQWVMGEIRKRAEKDGVDDRTFIGRVVRQVKA